MKEELLSKLNQAITSWLNDKGIENPEVHFEQSAMVEFGEYSTNVAMRYAKELQNNPFDIATELASFLETKKINFIEKVEPAKPGFVNIYLKKNFFAKQISEILSDSNWGANQSLSGKKIMIEYTQPNTFKPFHVGHLMSNAIGESLSRIFEISGAQTLRANYQGDIGPHVAKAVWVMLKKGKPSNTLSVSEKASYIGQCYVEGNSAYEGDTDAKREIDELNEKIYKKSDKEVNALYEWGREITLEAFEAIYKVLGTKFDRYYFESEMATLGKKIVLDNVDKVFSESDSAIVFEADKFDPKLHTRVFINSKGLPTYESKEIGLTVTKFEKESPDLSVVVTAVEQADYMKVIAKAVSILHPEYENKMQHVSHGMMRFADGKMSSRTGNVIAGESLLKDAQEKVLERLSGKEFTSEEKNSIATKVSVAAVKYSILKQALGFNIIYDFEESISFEGDSGPYLQYATVRAHALIKKAEDEQVNESTDMPKDWEVTTLERNLSRFSEVVTRSMDELEPHHIAVYLTELASSFNSFYGQGKIVDINDSSSEYRVALTKSFYKTMKNGLYLLGIETVDKM